MLQKIFQKESRLKNKVCDNFINKKNEHSQIDKIRSKFINIKSIFIMK